MRLKPARKCHLQAELGPQGAFSLSLSSTAQEGCLHGRRKCPFAPSEQMPWGNGGVGCPSSASRSPGPPVTHTDRHPSPSPLQPHQCQRGPHFGPLGPVHFLLHLQDVLQGPELGWVGVIDSFDLLKQSTQGFPLGKAASTDAAPPEPRSPAHGHQDQPWGLVATVIIPELSAFTGCTWRFRAIAFSNPQGNLTCLPSSQFTDKEAGSERRSDVLRVTQPVQVGMGSSPDQTPESTFSNHY